MLMRMAVSPAVDDGGVAVGVAARRAMADRINVPTSINAMHGPYIPDTIAVEVTECLLARAFGELQE
jgi:predicted NodU family carbamoyl transferase